LREVILGYCCRFLVPRLFIRLVVPFLYFSVFHFQAHSFGGPVTALTFLLRFNDSQVDPDLTYQDNLYV